MSASASPKSPACTRTTAACGHCGSVELSVAAGERVALGGLDGAAAEMIVNLVTGATLPDEGDVRTSAAAPPTSPTATHGSHRSTASGSSADAPCCSRDRLQQNLALPFTLELDPVPPEVAERVIARSRRVRASPQSGWAAARRRSPPSSRARTHLARALALDRSCSCRASRGGRPRKPSAGASDRRRRVAGTCGSRRSS